MKTDTQSITKNPSASDRANPERITLHSQHKNQALWQRYQTEKQKSAMLFPTEGARHLGVSEFELLLSAPHSRYLGQDCQGMLKSLDTLGRVQSIVRNPYCVHEQSGFYRNLTLGEMMGMGLGDGLGTLDLRLFLHRWRHMLAVVNTDGKKPSHSIQFFDERGQAINKVFLTDDSHHKHFHQLVDAHAKDAPDTIHLLPIVHQSAWTFQPLDDGRRVRFQEDWLSMTDIHQFYGILKSYGLDRPSGFRQAPQGYAEPCTPSLLERVLESAIQEAVPLMIFVGNTGIMQIYSGQIHTLKRLDAWLNILDEKRTGFSMHLNDQAISQLWLVKRPNGKDGDTLALEAFDDTGTSLITIFGERSEGKTQDPRWQALIRSLVSSKI